MPVGIPADILISRPDIQQAERLLAQATARIGQAEAARYPAISLTGNISTTGLKVGDLGKNSSIGWSVGPALSVPIFNGGQLQAAVEVAQAQRDQGFGAPNLRYLAIFYEICGVALPDSVMAGGPSGLITELRHRRAFRDNLLQYRTNGALAAVGELIAE